MTDTLPQTRFTNTMGIDEADEAEGISQGGGNDVKIAIAVFGILLMFACLILYAIGTLKKPQTATPPKVEEKTEKLKKRKEWIAKSLVVREWIPRGTSAETMTPSEDGNSFSSDEDAAQEPSTPTKGDIPTSNAAPQREIQVSCSFGTDDCGFFLAGESDCPICLATLAQLDLVCESNNPSCPHVYHKTCMEGWLLNHEKCPMCRQTYLLETE